MSDTPAASGTIDLSGLRKSPDLYPQNVQPVRQDFLFVQISEAEYRAASFLDNRLVRPGMARAPFPESEVVQVLEGEIEARPLHFIFHCGHVGSTLLSRLLDETEQVLPLREPLPLRVLADGYTALSLPNTRMSEERLNRYVEMFLKMWSRGYAGTRAVVLKATSSAARMAPRLLKSRPNARAVYMSLAAEPFLATLLAGPNSVVDLKGFAPERVRRLERHLGFPVPPPHLFMGGELAAMSWLTERFAEKTMKREFGNRVLSIDFDALLKDVKGTVASVVKHFGLEPDAKYLDSIAQSQVLKRYAKGPEHEYSPEMREELLNKARSEKDADIKKGLAWLERMAGKSKAAAELLQQKPA
ncbi:MAG: hypothetical protein ACT4OG_09545 [Alphaproteobacteria bacterium]